MYDYIRREVVKELTCMEYGKIVVTEINGKRKEVSLMNKYAYLFNEYMTQLQASSIMFRVARTLTSEKDKEELIDAWAKNDSKIIEREFEEYGNDVMTQAVM